MHVLSVFHMLVSYERNVALSLSVLLFRWQKWTPPYTLWYCAVRTESICSVSSLFRPFFTRAPPAPYITDIARARSCKHGMPHMVPNISNCPHPINHVRARAQAYAIPFWLTLTFSRRLFLTLSQQSKNTLLRFTSLPDEKELMCTENVRIERRVSELVPSLVGAH